MEASGVQSSSRFLSAFRLRNPRTRKSPVILPAVGSSSSSSSAEFGEGRNMFVFGMGFVGLHVSRRLKEEGWEISGTCTSEVKKKKLEDMGFAAFIFNDSDDNLDNLNNLNHATHLLISIPPSPEHGAPLLSLEEELRFKLLGGNLQWLGYLSSTSVYGNCGGAFVDEDYPPQPITPGAKARLSAELAWLDLGHDLGASSYVFRLGGIYGPGRSALDTIIKQEGLSKHQKMRESRKYTARIHVEDIYQAVRNSFLASTKRRVYNVVDDDPAPRSEVFLYAEDLIEEKWPGKLREKMNFAKMKRENDDLRGEKRVLNRRMKEELKVRLIYPSYRSGLRSILDSME